MNEKLKEALTMLKELGFEPVKDAINHRVKSPFFGGFVVSWLFLNWDRVLIICFSNGSIIERINTIRKIPNNSIFLSIDIRNSHTFWFPLAISITLTLLSPFISFILEWAHKRVTTATEANRFSKQAEILDKKSLLTEAEVRSENQKETALLEVKAQQEASRAAIAFSESNIDSLTNKTNALNEQIRTNGDTNNSLLNEISSNTDKLKALRDSLDSLEGEFKKANAPLNEIKKLRTSLGIKESEIKELKKTMSKLQEKDKSTLQFTPGLFNSGTGIYPDLTVKADPNNSLFSLTGLSNGNAKKNDAFNFVSKTVPLNSKNIISPTSSDGPKGTKKD